jgi:anthranilate synthase component 2
MVGELYQDIIVRRNDEISLEEIKELKPRAIIISPGPGSPENQRDFGVCTQVITELGAEIPILGICLGHQGIFKAFGGEVTLTTPVHGKQSQIFHREDGIFKDLENPLQAARYHSLLCNDGNTPDCIEVTARTKEGMIMGIKHKNNPIFGLQFHPESVGTAEGRKVLKNFLEISL